MRSGRQRVNTRGGAQSHVPRSPSLLTLSLHTESNQKLDSGDGLGTRLEPLRRRSWNFRVLGKTLMEVRYGGLLTSHTVVKPTSFPARMPQVSVFFRVFVDAILSNVRAVSEGMYTGL